MSILTQCDTCKGFSNEYMLKYVCPNHPDVFEDGPGTCPEGDGPLEQMVCGAPNDPSCPGHFFLVTDWESVRYPILQEAMADKLHGRITPEAYRPAAIRICDCTIAAPVGYTKTWDEGVEIDGKFYGPDGLERAKTPVEVWW